MPAEISPVYAPSFSQCRFWPPIATLDPFAASTAAGTQTKGGQTAISSRVWSESRGRKSRKKSRVWSGVLYIFQFAAISFLRMIPFTNEYGRRLALRSESFDTRQLLAFQKFQGCTTAGGNVCDLVGHAGGVYSGDCVTAAYDRSRARVIGDGLGDFKSSFGEGSNLEYTHGAIPDDGAGAENFLREGIDTARADIERHQVWRDGLTAADDLRFGVGVDFFGHHVI